MTPYELGIKLAQLEAQWKAQGLSPAQIASERDKFNAERLMNETKERIKASNGGQEPSENEIAKEMAASIVR